MNFENYDFDVFTGSKLELMQQNLNRDEFNSLLKVCPAKKLDPILLNIAGPKLLSILEALDAPTLAHLVKHLSTATLARFIDVGEVDFLSKVCDFLPVDEIVRYYNTLPDPQRNKFSSMMDIVGNSQVGLHINIASRRRAWDDFYSRQHDKIINDTEATLAFESSRKKGFEEGMKSPEQILLETQDRHLKQIADLKEQIDALQKITDVRFQERVEGTVGDFVDVARKSLEENILDFSNKAKQSRRYGSWCMGAAIAIACGSLWFGAIMFSEAVGKEKIDWLFFAYLMLKGLVVISLFGALAKHYYTVSNAYMHESLKRTDRLHAISFGKFYLELYGNNVAQVDMRAAFENWNLDSDSAFIKIKSTSLEPKMLGQLGQLFESMSKFANLKSDRTS